MSKGREVLPGFTPEVAEAFNKWLDSCDGDVPRIASVIFLAGWEAREQHAAKPKLAIGSRVRYRGFLLGTIVGWNSVRHLYSISVDGNERGMSVYVDDIEPCTEPTQ